MQGKGAEEDSGHNHEEERAPLSESFLTRRGKRQAASGKCPTLASSGNTKTNLALSQRRAENIYHLILAKGITPESVKIEVVGKGDSDNAVINLKRKFEQRNRRVEVFVR